MHLAPDEVRALRHRPLLNLLSQIIRSVGQPMPSYYMQRPDGTMLDMLDGTNGCAAYVSRTLAAMGTAGVGSRLIDGPHGTVASTVSALQQAGWSSLGDQAPKPGDIILWERQQQADGDHAHIGFYVANDEAVSTDYVALKVARHPYTVNAHGEPRAIEQLLRYAWTGEDYDVLAQLNTSDGTAVHE